MGSIDDMMSLDDMLISCIINNSNAILSQEQPEYFNATCLQMYVEGLYDTGIFHPLNTWEAILFSVAYFFIAVLGLFGNGLVVFAVIRKAEMRTNRNVFITNLAISNFILAGLLYPCLWMPSKEFKFPLGPFFCKFANSAPGGNVYCSTLTISVMAIDRYYLIRRARIVDSSGRKLTAVVLAVSIWVVSLALSLPLLINFEVRSFPFQWENLPISPNESASFGWPVCTFNATSFVSAAVGILQAIFLYIIPLIVLAFFNLKLTQFIQRRAHNSLLTVPEPSQIRSSRESCFTSGSAAQASEQRRSRTTSLMIAMAMSYGILWLPFTIVSLLFDFDLVGYQVHVDYTAKLVSMLSICVNPFLYGWLNTNFNREFREIFAQLPCYKWYQKNHPEQQLHRNSQTQSTKNVCLTVFNSDALSSCRVNMANHYGSLEQLPSLQKSPRSWATGQETQVNTPETVDCSLDMEGPGSHEIKKEGAVYEETAPTLNTNGPRNKQVSIVVKNAFEKSLNSCEVVLHDDEQQVLFL